MAIIQRQQFLGMDKDTEPGFMQPGMYQYALNCHVGSSERGNIGSVENVKGNTLVSFSLPAGVNKCIGTHEDIQNSRVIYFIWNSNNLHGIYEFNGLDLTISNLFESSILNFQEDYIITGVGFINGILSWCDNYNENRLLDLNNVSSYSSPYTEEMIMLIKRPPTYPPLSVRKKDLSFLGGNFITKKTFQFATRFVYKDNSISVLSPYSKLSVNTLSLSQIISGGVFVYITTPDDNNYIEVDLNIAEIISDTNFVSILKKVDVLVREGNSGNWGIFKSATVAEIQSSLGKFNFYNNTALTFVDSAYSNKSFDSVPLKSAAHAVIKNRIFLGRNTEGYTIGHNVNATITNTIRDVIPSSDAGIRVFKSYGTFNFGILWRDKYGRHSGVETNNSFNTLINVGYFPDRICPKINVLLSGTPPEWAYSYSLVRTKNLNQNSFQQLLLTRVQYLTGYDTSGNPVYVNSFSENAGIIETHVTYVAGAYSDTPYTFTSGDLLMTNYYFSTNTRAEVRGVTYQKSAVEAADPATYEQQGLAKLILERGDYGYLVGNITTNIGEIYSQAVNDGIFYEIGLNFPVTNPGTLSRSLSTSSIDVNNGDVYYTLRAIQKLGTSPGPLYINKVFVESMGLFDVDFLTNNSDIGQPSLVVPDAKQETKQGSVRFSNLYVQNSTINGLSSFEGLNESNLPYEYGPIYKLQVASNTESDGNVLLSVHSHETVSLYIGEVVYSDIAGKNTIGVSNDVIGAARALRGSFGTMNPESVVQHNGSVYGWDILKGVVWRYAADGLNPISNLKMKNYFYQKSRDIINIENVRVFATFDRYYNEYIISVNDETLAFNEAENRWVTYYSFVPEFYQKINTKIVSFKDGGLWIHDSSSTHNNFYGLQYTSKISPVCNVQPMNTKILLNISTSSQHKWVGIAITTPEGQLSDLRDTDYRTNETGYSANVLRDRNTPNIVLPQIPVLHGDLMRDYSFTTLLECTATESTILRFANFNVIPSENNN